MDASNEFKPVIAENFCAACEKVVLRLRRFLVDGVVTHFCSACVKNVPKVPLVDGHKEHNVCKECCEIFTATRSLKQHWKTQHSPQKPAFPCKECGKKYLRKFEMNEHYKKNHEGGNTGAESFGRVIVDEQENSDATQFSANMGIAIYSSPESDENSLQASLNSNFKNPRKRRADEEVDVIEYVCDDVLSTEEKAEKPQPLDELQSWCSVLAVTLRKLPPSAQVEMKIAISAMVGNKELEFLKKKEIGYHATST